MKKLEDLMNLEKQSAVEIRYCEIVADAEEENRRARILKSGDRYFYHEMQDGEVIKCFEVAVSWKPTSTITIFAFTPDGRHVYEIDSRNPLRVNVMRLKTASRGDQCRYNGHSVELSDNAIIFDGRSIPVLDDHEYAWKLMKTKIRAIGGAFGLFIELEHMAEEAKNGIYPLFASLYDMLAEKYPA